MIAISRLRGMVPVLIILAMGVAGPIVNAQTAPPQPANTGIDLSPFLNNVVFPVVAPILSGLIIWGVTRLLTFIGLKNTSEVRKYLEPALQRALAYGQAKIGDTPITIDVKNDIVAQAVNYALAHVGDAVKSMGLDGPKLAEILLARLQDNLNAQSPAITATTARNDNGSPAVTSTPPAIVAVPVAAAA